MILLDLRAVCVRTGFCEKIEVSTSARCSMLGPWLSGVGGGDAAAARHDATKAHSRVAGKGLCLRGRRLRCSEGAIWGKGQKDERNGMMKGQPDKAGRPGRG